MSDYIEAIYDKKIVKKYIEDIVQAEETELFLPLSFISDGDEIKCIHKVRNLYPFSCVNRLSAEKAINLMIELMKKIKSGERHYIFCEDYFMDEPCIFLNEDYTDIRICYVPAEKAMCLNGKMVKFLIALERKVSDEAVGYIMEIEKYLNENNPDYRNLTRFITKISREMIMKKIP